MSTVLIINAGKNFGHSGGKLNEFLTEKAREFLEESGHAVLTTVLEDGYKIEEEVEKIVKADALIFQMPAWWMHAPWTMKKYMDDVFTAGHGKLYTSDGRSRSDSSKKYGSGGLAKEKKYMFSMTWNAPAEAFEDPEQFFEGKGIDGVLFPFHKACQFLGMSPLPTIMFNDVMKDPHIAEDIVRYKKHLSDAFGKAG